MRVLHGITRLGGAGAERQMRNVVLTKVDPGLSHSVFSFASGEFEETMKEAGVHVFVGDYSRQKLPLAVGAMVRCVRRDSIGLLQSWDPQFDVLMGVAAKLSRRPFVGSERNCAAQYTQPEGYGRAWFRHLRGPVLKGSASVVVANSKAGRDYIAEVTQGRTKCLVIRNGIDVEDLDARASVAVTLPDGDRPFIVVINRLNGPKRTEVAIREYDLLAKQGCEENLIILGTGPEEDRLRKLVRELKLTERVRFLGYQQNAPAYVARAAAMLSTSSAEGTPNSVIEAMALGTPVVVSNIEPHAELAEESGGGVSLFDPSEAGAGCKSLATLLSDCTLRQERIDRAKTFARGLTLERMAESFARVYREVAAF